MSAPAIARSRPRLLVSELTKLITLRAVWISALVTFAVVVLIGWSQAGPVAEGLRRHDPDLAPGASPATVGFDWVALGLIGIIVIGVISASSEFVSGQLRSSMVAVPQRWRLYGAKCAALMLFTTGLGLVTIPLLSLLSQAAIGELSVLDGGFPAELVFRWLGAIAFWDASALIGFSLGILLRQGLIPLFLLIVLSQLSLMLLLLGPALAYLPTIAGVQLFDAGLVTGSFPNAALGLPVAATATAAWTVGLLLLAGWKFVARDVRN
ncbi:hypothetical protein ACIPY3_17620 [Paenarthrobacter sp. NPDC089714]|uniref:hypothetical protein n=1 Tax=Paenarthrobacter sp. NPDC089714 TaxID=3364377 RepID=UPI003830CA7A